MPLLRCLAKSFFYTLNILEMPFGFHMLVDCQAGSMIDSKANIVAFVKELVNAIDMVAYGETWCERFATHDPEKGGYSMFQMIETSNISGHFVDSNGNFYLDVFSCKPFDEEVVEKTIKKYFKPSKMSSKFIFRNA